MLYESQSTFFFQFHFFYTIFSAQFCLTFPEGPSIISVRSCSKKLMFAKALIVSNDFAQKPVKSQVSMVRNDLLERDCFSPRRTRFQALGKIVWPHPLLSTCQTYPRLRRDLGLIQSHVYWAYTESKTAGWVLGLGVNKEDTASPLKWCPVNTQLRKDFLWQQEAWSVWGHTKGAVFPSYKTEEDVQGNFCICIWPNVCHKEGGSLSVWKSFTWRNS